MKRIFETTLVMTLLFLPGVASASMSKPFDSGDSVPIVVRDTFPADIRQPGYYYTKWFDECSNYYPNGGVVDSCFCRYPEIHCFYGSPVAKWEHTNHRMRVDGLVAMVDRYSPPDAVDSSLKLPEYLYLYQLVGRHYVFLQSYGIEDGLDLVLLDSVRWDTATARVMELRRGWNGEYNQYCYMYEAYFEHPVYVDSDFYIFGSSNSNHGGSNSYIQTVYTDIMDYSNHALRDGCDIDKYMDIIVDECKPQGGLVGIRPVNDLLGWGWYTPWPDSPWGYYLPLITRWNLDAMPNDTSFGEVHGGGYYLDSTYVTIEAVPVPGYYFQAWNDGVTDNPRVIQLTSDTTFVAIFNANERYDLTVISSDETQGAVTGGGSFLGDTDNTIAATPGNGYRFSHWNDGLTDNPLVVHLVSDTTFVAYFAARPYYTVETATNNDEWGSVAGGGMYMEGEEATLTVTTEPFCLFEGWSDGDGSLPRVVTVTQDTLFTALFSFDSSWTDNIGKAGTLDFAVSPNPTTGLLTMTLGTGEPCDVAILDMNGKVVLRKNEVYDTVELDLASLPSGQYLLLVNSRDRHGIRKIVKK